MKLLNQFCKRKKKSSLRFGWHQFWHWILQLSHSCTPLAIYSTHIAANIINETFRSICWRNNPRPKTNVFQKKTVPTGFELFWKLKWCAPLFKWKRKRKLLSWKHIPFKGIKSLFSKHLPTQYIKKGLSRVKLLRLLLVI